MNYIKNYHPVSINQLFDEIWNNFEQSNVAKNRIPANIMEADAHYVIDIIAPGRKKEHFSIETEKGVLTISYQANTVTEHVQFKVLRQEYKSLNFNRSFTLDNKIDLEKIEAKYTDGVLSIILPKKVNEQVSVKNVIIQ